MGIVLTKYEDTTNSNVVFDSSKFDYDYDSDTFPATTLSDVDEILIESGDVYYLRRQSITNDTLGAVSAISETDLRIYAIIQDITRKDRLIHEMGLAIAGSRKMYLRPFYPIVSGGVTTNHEVKEGDIFIDSQDSQIQWRVTKILDQHYLPNQEVFRTAIIQSINLEGSS